MELVPEAYVVELSPTSYPRAPISKKRIWYDARTLCPLTMITFDRQGKLWQQWEGGFDYYQAGPGCDGWMEYRAASGVGRMYTHMTSKATACHASN